MKKWYNNLSSTQKILLISTFILSLSIISTGIYIQPDSTQVDMSQFAIHDTIADTAKKLGVTSKHLTKELALKSNVSKNKSLIDLGINQDILEDTIEHILSHKDVTLKYFIYFAIALMALVYLLKLGRPNKTDLKNRKYWYPTVPYIIILFFSVISCGFLLGKSPNPMEGTVKVFKSFVGLYPDPLIKIAAFIFFIFLAIIGNKLICGWACPFGAIEELVYTIPVSKSIKKIKIPFWISNSIRAFIFLFMLLILFGIAGDKKGSVIYHYVNPFNIFNLDFKPISVLITIIVVLPLSLIIYRPFCQFICPFGLLSWTLEKFSINKVKINHELCTKCGACINACPTQTTKGMIEEKKILADCFSCTRCLKVCPVDAIKYDSIFKD